MDLLKKFVYKRNVFDELSLIAIKPILSQKSPRDLQELRLVNLQIGPKVIEKLLQYMIKARIELRTLGLV